MSITVTVQMLDGTTVQASVDPTGTLASSGFLPSGVCMSLRGRVIKPYATFMDEGVRDGDTLACEIGPTHLIVLGPKGPSIGPLTEEQRSAISQLRGPLRIVAIVGQARGGKSTLQNFMFGAEGGGFSVGHSEDPHTKGLWFRAKAHPDGNGTLVQLDSEGLGDPSKGAEHDAQVYCLTLALASTLIVNCKGFADRTLFESLAAMTVMAERLSSDDQDAPDFLCPELFVVVRDHFLDLDPCYGGSTDKYFEKLLMRQPGQSSEIKSSNEIRDVIRTMFRKRHMRFLRQPYADPERLHRLHEERFEDLPTHFLDPLTALREEVVGGGQPKLVWGTKRRGAMELHGTHFLRFVEGLAEGMTNHRTCPIPTAVDILIASCRDKALISAKELYGKAIAAHTFPLNDTEFATLTRRQHRRRLPSTPPCTADSWTRRKKRSRKKRVRGVP